MTIYDLIIIGGGPAGTSAAVYAARKQLKTLMIVKEIGGQSMVSPDIHNWIGTPSISGTDLAKSFQSHIEAYADTEHLDVLTGALATRVEQEADNLFTVTTSAEETYQSRSVLIASGSRRRHLEVPGAAQFENKGVVYCASCDGPLFAGQDVVVIGGGNAGFESAAQLLAYAKSVTLLHRNDSFKADLITVEKVLEKEHMKAIKNANTLEVLGDKFVTGIRYQDKVSGKEHTLDATGVFVEIGQIPNTDLVQGLVELDDYNRIIIDPWNQRTSVEGVWAAGDATNVRFHQNNISAGDAVKALEDLYLWLHRS